MAVLIAMRTDKLVGDSTVTADEVINDFKARL